MSIIKGVWGMMIRRPLLYVAAGYSAAVFITYHEGLIIGASVCLALFITTLAIRDPDRALAILCISFIAGTAAFAYCDNASDPLYEKALSDPGAHTHLSGKLLKLERRTSDAGETSFRMTVSVKASEGVFSSKSRVLANYYGQEDLADEVVPGCLVELGCSLDLPEGRRNPGCFDQRLYLRTQGIRTVAVADSVRRADPGSQSFVARLIGALTERLYLFRQGFAGRLARDAGEGTAAMMQAILFGDKSELDEQTLENFQKNGTAHILAVSGLHIGMIYGFLLKIYDLLGKVFGLGRRGWGFLSFTALFFLCYMILASFSPSVVRAVCMVLLHAYAKIKGLRYDLASAAFFIFLLVLVRNPYMLFNTGFQMSFLAVLSMSLVLPYLKRVYSGVFLASLAVQIGLGPFILYQFNCFSLLAVLINVPVIMLTGVLVPAGLCCAFLPVLTGPVRLMCDALRYFNEMTAVDGVTTFTIASPDVRLIMLYYLHLLCLASEAGRLRLIRARSKKKYVAGAIAFALAVSLAFGNMCGGGFDRPEITFVDVGQGDCMCIRHRDGLFDTSVYLIDGGGSVRYNLGKKTLKPYLLKNGMDHVDIAFATHLHTDHYLGICQLAREGMVDRLCVYDGNRLREDEICKETGLSPSQITYLSAGDSLDLGEDLRIEALWPLAKTDSEYSRLIADETNENDMSLLFKVTCEGVSMLATGDMDENGEKVVIAMHQADPQTLRADILKVGHHGSKYSTSDIFLDYVNPKTSVIQVGKNNTYGHPTPETLARLTGRGIPVYRTDLSGAIGIDVSDRNTSFDISTIFDIE
ncbi:MAG: DNA internalization-related competence protein ComEC/Rec2 [Bacillota bacterium]|nr:DNA internalization-related competence protein ComEC/Rec2 [Bacillota bacterium]